MPSAPRSPRTRRPKAEPDVEIVVEPVAESPTCNVCPEPPEWRGLCSAHRQTHRGLADPKEA